jgi:hypothetical protein
MSFRGLGYVIAFIGSLVLLYATTLQRTYKPKRADRTLLAYFYHNEKRWHQDFDRKTRAVVYFGSLSQKQAAA